MKMYLTPQVQNALYIGYRFSFLRRFEHLNNKPVSLSKSHYTELHKVDLSSHYISYKK